MTTTEQPGPQAEPVPASAYLCFWAISLGVLFLDQASKWIIVEYSGYPLGLYPPFGGKVLIPGFLNLAYAINHGAAWGMLEGYSFMLVAFAVLVLGLMAVFRHELDLRHSANQWCFGLICGGIIGNTIDRILRGHVVDFIDLRLSGYQWPTFNLADSAIVVGTVIYIYLQFKPRRA
ncbi:MAG: signal peptidase II [Opitutales bacterium]|jgi:signal peptidase II